MIKNYMEILVDEIYNEIKSSLDHCATDDCVHNIKSMALNNLTPKYFLTTDEAGSKNNFLLSPQGRISVLTQLIESSRLLCANCPDRKI